MWAYLLAPDPGLARVSRLFLRLLGAVYLAAFASVALEITGLVGNEGILPAGQFLAALKEHFGTFAWVRFPTLFWLGTQDGLLLGAAYAGCLFAVLLMLGWRPLLSTLVLFALYLSIYRVGQLFFNFQWDYLLLEAGFLAILLAAAGPGRLLVFLFHWLLFRLRFLSGLSKLMSGDPAWSGLHALQHYFETQPLPHLGSWYAHQLPDWLLRAGTGTTLFMELVVPFFIFLPRPFRLFAALSTILLQLLIILSSNHNFFNILTIALCLFLLDDRALSGWRRRSTATPGTVPRPRAGAVAVVLATAVIVPASALNIAQFSGLLDARSAWLEPVNWANGWGLAHVYHVFPNMQTERHELLIQGSADGREWHSYRFRFKTDDPGEAPRWAVPLQPRLDWMMWFLPPQNPAMRRWFEPLMWRLHKGSPAVSALFAHDPFAGRGARHLRVLSYRYRFTTPSERAASGRYWQAEYLGEFPRVPPRRP